MASYLKYDVQSWRDAVLSNQSFMENLHDVLYMSNSATQAGTEFNFNTLFTIWKCQKIQTVFGTVQAQIKSIRLQDDEIYVPSGSSRRSLEEMFVT